MNKYIGNSNQLFGVEKVILDGGKGNGMHMFIVRNGAGLEFYVSADRCADISKAIFKGDNMGYFSPCGYVAPSYYDNEGLGFLKSFTAGFFTTCGLSNVGSPCEDEGEKYGLHGSISNTPSSNSYYFVEDGKIHIKATVEDAAIFNHKLALKREYICPVDKNEIYITDKIINSGSAPCPIEILYHCNMGYPLLTEKSVVEIPSSSVIARNEHALSGIEKCLVMEKPQADYEEMCFYHTMDKKAEASIYNPDINKGVRISFDHKELGYFTEWKMMGENDYVLGLEPGNCTPDGRDVMRKSGKIEVLEPGCEKTIHLKFEFFENK